MNRFFKNLIDIGIERNLIVYDADAPPGEFTEKLAGLICARMQELSSDRRGRVTDMFLSDNGYYDMTNKINYMFKKFNYHRVLNLGRTYNDVSNIYIDNEYQKYFIGQAASMAYGDLEIGISLDLSYLTDNFESLLDSDISKLDPKKVLMFSY